jgi:hypothetical protein
MVCDTPDMSVFIAPRGYRVSCGRTAREEETMSTVKEAVDIEVPVRIAYNQWTQFEEFPNFMEGVEEVRQLDERQPLDDLTTMGGVITSLAGPSVRAPMYRTRARTRAVRRCTQSRPSSRSRTRARESRFGLLTTRDTKPRSRTGAAWAVIDVLVNNSGNSTMTSAP